MRFRGPGPQSATSTTTSSVSIGPSAGRVVILIHAESSITVMDVPSVQWPLPWRALIANVAS
jgi:hypothetical protein